MKFLVTFKGIIIMLCASILMLVFSLILNNVSFFALGEFLSGLVGVFTLLGVFIYLTQFHFLNILSASTLIGTGLGTFSTYTNVPKVLGTDWSTYVGSLGISVPSVTTAQIVVNFFCLFSTIFGYLSTNQSNNATRGKNKLSYTEQMLGQIRQLSTQLNACYTLLIITGLVSLLQGYVLGTGMYSYRGFNDNDGVINPFAGLVVSASPIAVFSLGLLSSKFKVLEKKLNKNILIITYASAISIQLIWFLGTGRRDLIYAAILYLFGLRCSYVVKNNILHKNNIKLLVILLLLLPFLYFCLKFFMFIRVLSYREPLLLKSNLFDIVNYAWSEYFSSDPQFLDRVQEKESYNLSTRTFVLNYLAALIQAASDKQPLYGQDIFSNILNALPRFIFSDKASLLMNEPLYRYEYGLPNIDSANSLYFSAYGDFSWSGTLIYPLILFIVFYVCSKLFLLSSSPYFIVLAVSSLVQISLSGGENDITSWIVTLRNLFIFFLLFEVLNFFLLLRKQKYY